MVKRKETKGRTTSYNVCYTKLLRGGIGMAADLAPGSQFLHPLVPGITNGLAGVAAGPTHRGAIQQREQFRIQPPAEIRLVIAVA